MKVVIITNIPAPYRVDLYAFLNETYADYDFEIVYSGKSFPGREWTLNEDKLKYSHFLDSKLLSKKSQMDNYFIQLPKGLFKTLDKINPSVVIAMEYNPSALQAFLWCRLKGRKYIHLTDGTLASEDELGIMQKLSRYLIIRHSDALIASSTKAEEKLLWYGAKKELITKSLLTIDINPYKAIKRCPIPGRILFTGRLVHKKGIDLLIEALPYIESDYELRIVGNSESDDISNIESRAKELNVLDKISFGGYLESDDLYKEYSQANVFVFPSINDCFGLVLIEALCSGIPIVSSTLADGTYDVVKNGINGYLANPYDAKGFAEAIDKAFKLNISDNPTDKFSFNETTKGYIEAIEIALQH